MPELYRVNITNQALVDLESIFEYVRRDSLQNAAKLIERLLDAIDDLEFMPGRFRAAAKSRTRGTVMHARVMRPFIIY
jgi:plasmid stabilization system protein ParE